MRSLPDATVNGIKNLRPFRFGTFSESETERDKAVRDFLWKPIDGGQPEFAEQNPVEDMLPHIRTDGGRMTETPPGLFRGKAENTPAPPAVSEEEKLLEKARREADEILETARKEGESIRESARASGRAEGYEKGFSEGKIKAQAEQETILQQTLQYYLEDVKKAVEHIETEKERILGEYLDDLRDLSITVAEKVINTSLQSSGQVIEKMIIAATDRMKNREWAKVSISRHDADLMMQGDMDIISSLQNISENIKVTVMDSAEPGTCIIEFPDQIIDASVKTQLDNIRELLDIPKKDRGSAALAEADRQEG